MSLYNQLFKTDALAPFLLGEVLCLDYREVPRFRDCYLNEDGTKVVVLTRTGGGNRAEYEDENRQLAQHSCYTNDEDAGEDSTYAYFYFEPSEQFRDKLKEMALEQGRRPAIERFMELIAKLNDPDHQKDSEVVRALEVGRKILQQIEGAMILQEMSSDLENPPDAHIIEV